MTPDEFRNAIANAARNKAGELTAHSWEIADAVLPLVLAALDAERQRADVAEAAHEEAERYAAEGWAWLDDALKAAGWASVFDIPRPTRETTSTDAPPPAGSTPIPDHEAPTADGLPPAPPRTRNPAP